MKFSEGQGVTLLPLFHYIEDLLSPYHCISFIGGGGKTSLMIYSAEVLKNTYERILLTTTTHLSSKVSYNVNLITASYEEAANFKNGCVLFVGKEQNERYQSPDTDDLEKLSNIYDKVLIEADGSKMLPLKFHSITEPVIPRFCDFVVSVIGLDCLGKPIREVMHRYEDFLLNDYSSSYKYSDESNISVLDIEKLILDPNGCYKGIIDKKKSILIFNKVDCILDFPEFKDICRLAKSYSGKIISVKEKYSILY